LLHGNEQRVYEDSAYASQKDLIHSAAPNAKDFTNQRTRRNAVVNEVLKARNRNKCKIRARAEHVFCVVKRNPRIYGTRLGQHLPQPPAVDGTGVPIKASSGPNAHVKATRGH
jgi:IS5 family transposase